MAQTVRTARRTKPGADEDKQPTARSAILEAAQATLQREGFTGLSTRAVARAAGVPLSQIHYHFGSKEGLVLELLAHLDRQLFERQTTMFDTARPLSARWRMACDFLDQDMDSGYVRLLQECTAEAWSNPRIAEKVRELHDRWLSLLARVAEEAEPVLGPYRPFTPHEVATLVAKAFLGAESMLLLGINEKRDPIRTGLRKIGDVIEARENANQSGEAP